MDMATLGEFWDLVVQVWQEGVYGINIAQVLVALVIFGLFMVFRNLFSRFVLRFLRRAAARTRTDMDNRIVNALYEPIRFIPVVMGVFFALSVLDVEEGTREVFYKVNRTLIAFTLFWAFYRITTPASTLLMKAEGVLTRPMVEWLVKAAKVAFIVLGAATILELWGIAVAPIIAGLGLFGVAVALGAQDLFKNLIAGLFVIGERRFFPGDWINVDGVVEGTVQEIGFRTTTVRRFDRAPVYVPNARLADNAVTNFSRMSHRRIRWMVGVEYRTTMEQLRQIRDGIERYILENEEFADPSEVPTFVRIDSFNDSSIDILVYCFTNTIVWGDWLEIKERLAYAIKEIVEGAGTGFAFPSRSVYLETLPDAPEVFPLSPPRGATPASQA
ncbi:mechanosensitive ion channel protein MscS [Thioalkalivibrio denitrificans]|uniref:Mechanosensitive ion channel protein MscS n=1 Tax=Thioalkalivibrio denitrificans TaxID=108003 RepID=A0A1V3NA57_9GAMM|nr:mechanosensitive ion channel family protein [Thioalkalivibrio denitrificans]OOG21979.1 mechanosensitive ion channel protein MscS [Thioalkalivibrio denitrificans]